VAASCSKRRKPSDGWPRRRACVDARSRGGILTERRDDPPATTPEADGTEPAARWEDYIDIFLSPASVFRRRAHDAVAPPLITLLVLGAVLYIVLIPANRIIVAASTAAADPQAAAFLEQYGTLMQVLGVVMVPITTLMIVLFSAAVLWVVAHLAGVTLPFPRALLVATYAAFVLLVGQVVGALLALLHAGGPIDIYRDLSIGAARLLPPGEVPATTMALLRRVDLFAIWQAVLWGVGVRWVGRTTTGRAAVVAAATWALVAVPTFVFALIRPTPPM
jgi:hypothetical protein